MKDKIGFVKGECSRCRDFMNGYDGPVCKKCLKKNSESYSKYARKFLKDIDRFEKNSRKEGKNIIVK